MQKKRVCRCLVFSLVDISTNHARCLADGLITSLAKRKEFTCLQVDKPPGGKKMRRLGPSLPEVRHKLLIFNNLIASKILL